MPAQAAPPVPRRPSASPSSSSGCRRSRPSSAGRSFLIVDDAVRLASLRRVDHEELDRLVASILRDVPTILCDEQTARRIFGSLAIIASDDQRPLDDIDVSRPGMSGSGTDTSGRKLNDSRRNFRVCLREVDGFSILACCRLQDFLVLRIGWSRGCRYAARREYPETRGPSLLPSLRIHRFLPSLSRV